MEFECYMASYSPNPIYVTGKTLKAYLAVLKIIKLTLLTVISTFLISCSAPAGFVGNSCEVRLYHQQVLMTQLGDYSRAGAVPSPSENNIYLPRYITDELWLIQDYVRVKKWPSISEPKVANYDKISLDTTFLIVGVEVSSDFNFEGQKYFDGEYAELGLDKACPIFTGRRNDKFALATFRKVGGETSDARNRCNAYATFAFFGLSKEELENYSNYVKIDLFGPEYDFNAIRTDLEAKKHCAEVSDKKLRRIASDGNAEAQFKLGKLYALGLGGVVPRDDTQALNWLRLAANQGHAEAQTFLGDMAQSGIGGDDVQAVKWYRLAAKQGSSNAQLFLSQMFADGKGVEKDYVQSYLWASNAAETTSDRHVQNLLRSLAEHMTKEQITYAETLAVTCVKSIYQDCEITKKVP